MSGLSWLIMYNEATNIFKHLNAFKRDIRCGLSVFNHVLVLMLNISHTHRRSCVITTSPCWQAACRAEPGSLSAKSDLEERARLRGPLMSSLVQWAKRSNSFGRLCSITAKRRRPDSVISGPSPGVGGGSGATKSFCSYLARIQDSRSSLEK